MLVRSGYTRLVILHGGYAYKIARLRFLRTFIVIVDSLLSPKNLKERRGKFPGNPVVSILNNIFIGWLANRSEYQYWQDTKDTRCIPTLKSYLGGLVIVQPLAPSVNMEAVLASDLRQMAQSDQELSRPEQYGLYQGQCVIVDYAHLGGFTFGQPQNN